MTFKELLSNRAEYAFVNDYVEEIKNKLEQHYKKHKYIISLIIPHTTMVYGDEYAANHTTIILTKQDDLKYYGERFVKAFEALGFTDENVVHTFESNEACDSCDITLRW